MNDAMHHNLLRWVQNYRERLAPELQVESFSDLCDGVLLAKILHDIDPTYVNMQLINPNATGNYVLKANNLAMVVRGIQISRLEQLGLLRDTDKIINTSRIALEDNVDEIAKLVELLLGCLYRNVKLSNHFSSAPSASVDEDVRSQPLTMDDLCSGQESDNKRVLEQGSTMKQKCLDLERANRSLERKLHILTLQLVKRNDELLRIRQKTNEYAIQLDRQTLRQKNEMSMIQSKQVQFARLELSVMRCKSALDDINDDMNDVIKRNQELRWQNAELQVKVQELKSLVRVIPFLKALVEKYKNQFIEVDNAKMETKCEIVVLEQKIRRLQEKLTIALTGKAFFASKVAGLRNQIAYLEQQSRSDARVSADAIRGLRDRIARVEREKAILLRRFLEFIVNLFLFVLTWNIAGAIFSTSSSSISVD